MTLETSRGQNIFKRCVCVALTSQRNQQGLRKVVLKVEQSSSYLRTFANSGFKEVREAASSVVHFIGLKGNCAVRLKTQGGRFHDCMDVFHLLLM